MKNWLKNKWQWLKKSWSSCWAWLTGSVKPSAENQEQSLALLLPVPAAVLSKKLSIVGRIKAWLSQPTWFSWGKSRKQKPAGGLEGKKPVIITGFYILLGLETTATLDEVKKSRDKILKKYHPDKAYSDIDHARLVVESYDVIETYELTGTCKYKEPDSAEKYYNVVREWCKDVEKIRELRIETDIVVKRTAEHTASADRHKASADRRRLNNQQRDPLFVQKCAVRLEELEDFEKLLRKSIAFKLLPSLIVELYEVAKPAIEFEKYVLKVGLGGLVGLVGRLPEFQTWQRMRIEKIVPLSVAYKEFIHKSMPDYYQGSKPVSELQQVINRYGLFAEEPLNKTSEPIKTAAVIDAAVTPVMVK